MKKILNILTAVCIVAITATCINAVPVKKVTTKKTSQKSSTKNIKNKTITNDVIKSFRYELYKDDMSEVYYYSNNSALKSSQFYKRDMGSNTGWTYTVNNQPVKALSQLAAELKLDTYPMTELDDEDTSRDRWIIEVNYENGKHLSIITYLSTQTKNNDASVQQKCENVFKNIKFQDENGNMMGEFTKTIYADGKRIKEIYYTQDGIVHGGRDFTEPARGIGNEYALPPKTY